MPDGWKAAHEAWSVNCERPEDLEYILTVHVSDWASSIAPHHPVSGTAYTGRRCSVQGWIEAAKRSHGQVLIMGADDFFVPENWDTLLSQVIGDRWDTEFVLHVSTGSPRDVDHIAHPMMSRKLYERWGYFVWPGYESMYVDDDISARAHLEGVVIDARHLMFEHRHVSLGKSPDDEVYRYQNRPEAYQLGRELFAKRQASGFKDVAY